MLNILNLILIGWWLKVAQRIREANAKGYHCLCHCSNVPPKLLFPLAQLLPKLVLARTLLLLVGAWLLHLNLLQSGKSSTWRLIVR